MPKLYIKKGKITQNGVFSNFGCYLNSYTIYDNSN